MMKRVLKITTFFLFLFAPYALFSHICIDVQEFEFSSDKKSGIRVSIFNTEGQKFESIKYYSYPEDLDFNRDKEELFNSNPYNLKLFYSGRIKFPDNFNMNNFIIWDGAHITLLHNDIIPKSALEISDKLKLFNSGAQGIPFETSFYENGKEIKRTFSNLCSNKKEKRDERKFLGELATKYAMLSFGYKSLPSQNKSNHGFDGVFIVDSQDTELFLTESKCRGESKSAQDYLEQDLCEKQIHRKCQQTVYTGTKKTIEEFIQKKPQKIFKLAHRVKANGESQYCIEVFNKDIYLNNLLHTLSYESPEDNKTATMERISKQLYSNPQDFLKTCFMISGMSKQEISTFALK